MPATILLIDECQYIKLGVGDLSFLVCHQKVQTVRKCGLRDLNKPLDTPDLEKIWSEGSILSISGQLLGPTQNIMLNRMLHHVTNLCLLVQYRYNLIVTNISWYNEC